MKSHERLKAEGRVEHYLTRLLQDEEELDEKHWFRDGLGNEYLIEIRATYLGSKSKKRLTEPLVD